MAGGTKKPQKRKQKTKPDNPEQSKRFIESAKKLGLDGKGEDFERAMGVILKPKKKH